MLTAVSAPCRCVDLGVNFRVGMVVLERLVNLGDGFGPCLCVGFDVRLGVGVLESEFWCISTKTLTTTRPHET